MSALPRENLQFSKVTDFHLLNADILARVVYVSSYVMLKSSLSYLENYSGDRLLKLDRSPGANTLILRNLLIK